MKNNPVTPCRNVLCILSACLTDLCGAGSAMPYMNVFAHQFVFSSLMHSQQSLIYSCQTKRRHTPGVGGEAVNVTVLATWRASMQKAVAAHPAVCQHLRGDNCQIKSPSLMSIDHNLPPGLNYIASRPPTSPRCGEEY